MEHAEDLTVVLTGSAGYLGSRVKKRLEKIGVRIIEIDQSSKSNPIDLSSSSDLLGIVLPSSYLLIHLAFPLPGTLRAKKFQILIKEINLNLVSTFSPQRTLFISSTAVYPLNHAENIRVKPWEIYGKMKYESEVFLSSKLQNLTIFRPGTLVEMHRESTMMRFIKQLRSSPIPLIPGKGGMVHPFTHTTDLENAIIQWVVSPVEIEGATDLTAQNHKSLMQISEQGRSRKPLFYIRIPELLLCYLGSDSLPINGISRWHFRALCYDYKPDKMNQYSVGFKTYDQLFTS